MIPESSIALNHFRVVSSQTGSNYPLMSRIDQRIREISIGTCYAPFSPMPYEITSYRDLVVWQQAMELAELVYDLTEAFPRHELFGLTSQMRRAAVSIPSNIAEGTRHRTRGYLYRVIIALGEHAELETQAILSLRRSYLSSEQMTKFDAMSASVGRLAHALVRSLEARILAEGDPQSPITYSDP
jgi:four helix bundle protein